MRVCTRQSPWLLCCVRLPYAPAREPVDVELPLRLDRKDGVYLTMFLVVLPCL